MNSLRLRFWILVIIVFISGFSQGMLLPLIALILENDGVSPAINGMHATGMYIGVLLASPFMEAPLRKYGYKPLIIAGGITVIVSLFAFTLWRSLAFWFVLRLLIGIGDHALHFSTQTWITSFSPENARGKNLSIYGLSFGLGFAIGPIMARLVTINENLPFILAAVFSLAAWLTIFALNNEKPEQSQNEAAVYSIKSTFGRFNKVFILAWAALLPAFCYGLMEASLNSNFPVYALRTGIDISSITIIVSAFFIGGIIFQIPLGILSDKFGRKKILLSIILLGSFTFIVSGIFDHSAAVLMSCFFFGGMLLGSTFSLSMAYMTDIVPKQLLPSGNLMIGMCFSIGSISGPFLVGLAIEHLPSISMFYLISGILIIISMLLASYRPNVQPHQAET